MEAPIACFTYYPHIPLLLLVAEGSDPTRCSPLLLLVAGDSDPTKCESLCPILVLMLIILTFYGLHSAILLSGDHTYHDFRDSREDFIKY